MPINRRTITSKLRKANKLKRLRRRSDRAKKRADYLASPKGLAKETVKGLPSATKKVFGNIFKFITRYTKLPKVKKTRMTDRERVIRAKTMERNIEIMKKFDF